MMIKNVGFIGRNHKAGVNNASNRQYVYMHREVRLRSSRA